MRLLKITPHGNTLQDPVIRPPRYAILSHTWGADECTLDRFQQRGADPAITTSSGLAKINAAAALALSEGHTHLWVDTCCIDKRNSTELSEAINSMYRYYADADVCYAYLSDVPPDDALHRRSSRFRDSRWWTRGWTLQELLAPQRVHFYSSAWTLLGTKAELAPLISEITRIPEAVLRGDGEAQHRVPGRSVGEIFSWASARRTSVDEDASYALLGVLDVSMPLLYGEGGARAFLRLQEELLRRHDDESIFAWEAPAVEARARPHWPLLAPSVAYFHGSHRFVAPRVRTRLESEPVTLTNRGVGVHLPLVQSSQAVDLFFALLDCRIEGYDESERQPAIKVLHLGGRDYARVEVHQLQDFNFGVYRPGDPDTLIKLFRPPRPMVFSYQPRMPRPVTGFAVPLTVPNDVLVAGKAVKMRLRVTGLWPNSLWAKVGSEHVVLNLAREVERLSGPESSRPAHVDTTVAGCLTFDLQADTGKEPAVMTQEKAILVFLSQTEGFSGTAQALQAEFRLAEVKHGQGGDGDVVGAAERTAKWMTADQLEKLPKSCSFGGEQWVTTLGAHVDLRQLLGRVVYEMKWHVKVGLKPLPGVQSGQATDRRVTNERNDALPLDGRRASTFDHAPSSYALPIEERRATFVDEEPRNDTLQVRGRRPSVGDSGMRQHTWPAEGRTESQSDMMRVLRP